MGEVGLWAHSGNATGAWHALDDHLEATGDLAARFAEPFGGQSIARWLGRSHDLGKATCVWQEALLAAAASGGATGVTHKRHAARLAGQEFVHGPGGQVAAVIAASALLGHHSGIPDLVTGDAGVLCTRDVLTDARLDHGIREALANVGPSFGDPRAEARGATLPEWLPVQSASSSPAAARRVEMFTRMVYSALVDADFLDTGQHFAGEPLPRLTADENFVELFDQFTAARADLLRGRSRTPVAAARDMVFEQAMAMASAPPGLFRMPAPTGSGKTLSTMGFALAHAAANSMRRVVIAVPFTSITTQNAAVYARLLDSPERRRVLEHHSAVLDGGAGANRWRRLAAENWDAPVVVTTTVQLFESLLSNRPGAARKLHRLADSVIVLDEVQALPMPLLPVILDILRTLVEDYRATVVLSTATQPQFWALPIWQDFPSISLLPGEDEVRAALRRVTYEWRLRDPQPSWSDVAGWLDRERQALVIVNTTQNAQDLHRTLSSDETSGRTVLHLSTRMCGAHRLDVLAQVRQLLDAAEPVVLVSTQVIEAGVDVDFPVVFRALAPAESIAQAAGRANREGALTKPGRVVVFDPAEGGLPGAEYRTATELTRQSFAAHDLDPDDPDALDAYYVDLYGKLLPGGASQRGAAVNQARESLKFRQTAALFHMIDSTGVPVIVDYDDPTGSARALVGRLEGGSPLTPDEWRFIQSRTATLSRGAAKVALANGLARSVSPAEQDGSSMQVLIWEGSYDPLRGVDPATTASADEVIW
jgi:CRISPR-associated endonuclease/helicase Cas3